MKFWNLEVGQAEDGSKVLDITIFGVIDPGFPFPGDTMSGEIAAQLVAHKDAGRINVRINSVGGDAFGGVAIYNLLREHPAAKAGNLTSTVEGLAASAASVIAMAGKTVMGKGAMMMVHSPWTIAAGDAQALRQQADVLDSVQESLLAIYEGKTKKKRAELKKMLEAETWMTAEDAKRNGFADVLADAPVKAKAEGESVILNTVSFPRDSVPAPILAMARAKAQTEEHEPEEPGHDPEPTPEADKPQPDPADPVAPTDTPAETVAKPITRAELHDLAPEVMDTVVAEAHAAGIAVERSRIKAILDLGLDGCDEIVHAAMVGDAPMDARDLAVAAIKARKMAGHDLLAARRNESIDAAGIRPSAPEKNKAASELEAAKSIAKYANERRGGVR